MKTIIEYIEKEEKPILSHGELWDIWAEFKDVRLENLTEAEIKELSVFVDEMASSFDTVWIALKILDRIITYTVDGRPLGEIEDTEEDEIQPHLKNFNAVNFDWEYVNHLSDYMRRVLVGKEFSIFFKKYEDYEF